LLCRSHDVGTRRVAAQKADAQRRAKQEHASRYQDSATDAPPMSERATVKIRVGGRW
jgi:hypothetical protein